MASGLSYFVKPFGGTNSSAGGAVSRIFVNERVKGGILETELIWSGNPFRSAARTSRNVAREPLARSTIASSSSPAWPFKFGEAPPAGWMMRLVGETLTETGA